MGRLQLVEQSAGLKSVDPYADGSLRGQVGQGRLGAS